MGDNPLAQEIGQSHVATNIRPETAERWPYVHGLTSGPGVVDTDFAKRNRRAEHLVNRQHVGYCALVLRRARRPAASGSCPLPRGNLLFHAHAGAQICLTVVPLQKGQPDLRVGATIDITGNEYLRVAFEKQTNRNLFR